MSKAQSCTMSQNKSSNQIDIVCVCPCPIFLDSDSRFFFGFQFCNIGNLVIFFRNLAKFVGFAIE
jgi:hypothetical protein